MEVVVNQDVTSRILQLLRVRLKNNPEISEQTVRALLEEQRETDFGDDEEILAQLIEDIEEER